MTLLIPLQRCNHRVHRVATATFWSTFHHDGKISPGWRWECTPTPFRYTYPHVQSCGVPPQICWAKTVFLKEPWNRFLGIKSASLCSLVGRYDNPIPTQFLAPLECLKIPALESSSRLCRNFESLESSSLQTRGGCRG
jgi:hypothetical protein